MPTGWWMSGLTPAKAAGSSSIAGHPRGSARSRQSRTANYLAHPRKPLPTVRREPKGHLKLRGVTRNNLRDLDVDIPLGVLTSVTGVSGSGKSSLISQFLVDAVAEHLGHARADGCRRATAWQPHGRDPGRQDRRRPRPDRPPRRGRPEADRPHAAIQPCDLYRPVRPRPAAVRRDAAGKVTPLRCRALLLQCRERPLRDLRGRRLRLRRAPVPAQRLCALPDLQGRALQRQDAGGEDPRQNPSRTCWRCASTRPSNSSAKMQH